MIKINKFIEQVAISGSVFSREGNYLTMQDWDSIFRRFAKMGFTGEIVYYCSPEMLEELLALLAGVNATSENGSYGEFHPSDNSWGFLIEATLQRGSYTVHAVVKPIYTGLLVPTLDESEWNGAEELAKLSIIID